MKYTEYENRFSQIVQTPETAPAVIQEILTELKSDFDVFESAKATIAEQEAKIKSLQETNIKLFMSQTGSNSEQTEEEAPEMDFAELVKSKME